MVARSRTDWRRQEQTYKWKPFLQARHISVRHRLKLAFATVFTSALWLASTWNLTKEQTSHLDSWGARFAARVAGLRHSAVEDIGHFWRRLHRHGHNLLQRSGGGLGSRRMLQLHSFAGHVARSQHPLVRLALRTRCLAWWRYHQRQHHGIRYGLHPKRFKAWRWEAQLVSFYGECEVMHIEQNAGWMLLAQCREDWRTRSEGFAAAVV